MATTTTKTAKVTLSYADKTTRIVTFGGVSIAGASFKANCKALNANLPTEFAQTFVSESGASCIGIEAAQFITQETEEIYNYATS